MAALHSGTLRPKFAEISQPISHECDLYTAGNVSSLGPDSETRVFLLKLLNFFCRLKKLRLEIMQINSYQNNENAALTS